MITDGTGNWHYLAVKSISGLLRGITSNHNGGFYCLNWFHPYTTEKKLRKHERLCNDHDFCHYKGLMKIMKLQSHKTLERISTAKISERQCK